MKQGLEARLRVVRPGGFRLDAEVRIEPGHTVAILGPNGAGKSTLVGALAGLILVDSAYIALAGRVLEDTADAIAAWRAGFCPAPAVST